MAIRTQQPQVLETVVVADTILMVQLQNERASPPLVDAAAGTRILDEISRHQAPLESHAIHVCAAFDEDF